MEIPLEQPFLPSGYVAMEIPLERLFLPSGCIAELTPEIVSRMLTYLPGIHGSTFTNTAGAAVPLRRAVLNGEGPWHLEPLSFFLLLRREGSIAGRLDLDLAATGLCRQIVGIIGIDSHECIRLVRLVGQGPWGLDVNSRRIRLVMEGAFIMLLRLATFLEEHDCKAFLADLTRVNSAWYEAGGEGVISETGEQLMIARSYDQGLHGWNPARWQDLIDGMDEARNSSLTVRNLSGHNTGRCAFQACVDPCERCLFGRKNALRHKGECVCVFHEHVRERTRDSFFGLGEIQTAESRGG
jgi:hypothetical protein